MGKNFVVTLFVSFIVVMYFEYSWATNYFYKQICVLEYGSEIDEIGLINEHEMEPIGPRSFWVNNKGQIYILDSVNQRIKILSDYGKLLGHHNINFMGSELVVDDNGDMFVFDPARSAVEQVDQSGKNLGAIKIDSRGKVPHGLRILNGDVIFSLTDRKATQTIALTNKIKGKSKLIEPFTILDHDGMKGFANKYFNTFLQRSKRKAGVFIFDKDNEELDLINFPIENVSSIRFINEDQNNNSYFRFEISDPNVKGVELSVYYLGAKREFHSAVINMPNNYFVWTSKLVQVDEKGNIYQVLPTENNVQINKWTR